MNEPTRTAGRARSSAGVRAEASAEISYRDRVRGCLMGGAVGDALGAGIEFDSLEQIRREHGPAGVTGYVPAYGRTGAITDDTQLVLASVEGMIRAQVRWDRGVCHPPSVVHRAYLRWWRLQTGQPRDPAGDTGWLCREPVMAAVRAPGNACLSGLASTRMGTPAEPANPQSKGCGTVMRSAPFGLLPFLAPEEAYEYAVHCAALTHGHPSALTAAGALAMMIRRLLGGETIVAAVHQTVGWLDQSHPVDAGETLTALRRALELAAARQGSPKLVERLGAGWVAEEALAIAVFCALVVDDAQQALLLAVNHSGDSDSTGAISGNLIGAAHGDLVLPPPWVADNEARAVVLQIADDLVFEVTDRERLHGDYGPHTSWTRRYPGG